MGFGEKTDFEMGRVLDLDKSYKNMIKPAAEAAGLQCIRADEIVHSGLIDVPMYEQLLNADVVVADLSTSNKNAFYELGVRHALRPFTTVVVAEDGIKTFPFDISHVAVRQYHHLGEDIGFDEVMRFRGQLTDAIKEIFNHQPRSRDSPVYTFLNELTPPALAAAVQAKVQEVINAGVTDKKDGSENGPQKPADTNAPGADAVSSKTHSAWMQQVDDAQKRGDWMMARSLLSAIRQMMKDELQKKWDLAEVKPEDQQEDPYTLQRLSLATYKSKYPNETDALIEAHHLLNLLGPGNSNDPETLGLWGAVHKRLWELKKDTKFLDEAIRAYERGFYIRNDHYNGKNYAFLLNLRAGQSVDPAEAISDFVEARRVRKEVLNICRSWILNNPMPGGENVPLNVLSDYLKNWYWVMATLGEAYVGIGDEDNALKTLQEAFEKAPESWMKDSTNEQLEKLKPLLADSPLKYIISKTETV